MIFRERARGNASPLRQAGGQFCFTLGDFWVCVWGEGGGVLIVGIWEHSYRKVERWGVCWGAIR